jgi:two-component system cell cycle sensor histidine kinase PleC
MRRLTGEEHGRTRLLQHYVRTAGSGISRRRAQRTLGAAKIEAELANRAKTEFLANMSHELRTPLNAIIGFADMIVHAPAGSGEPARATEYGTHIASAGRHLLGVVSDILDIAQIDSGSYEIEIVPCDIARALELSAACVKERTTAKHQLLSVVAERVPQVMADGRRLQQALINLLSSASQYTPEGGCVALRCARNGAGGVTITVSDNGRGMSEQELRLALAPFVHVQSAYARNGDGMALGVAVAKRLVELQGASFEMISVRDEGTRAEIKFSAQSLAVPGDTREGAAR